MAPASDSQRRPELVQLVELFLRAAARLGFQYEGLFRQAVVYKGRNRDTAWFSILDSEWPALREAFENWLHGDNFDADGRQRQRLSDLTAAARKHL